MLRAHSLKLIAGLLAIFVAPLVVGAHDLPDDPSPLLLYRHLDGHGRVRIMANAGDQTAAPLAVQWLANFMATVAADSGSSQRGNEMPSIASAFAPFKDRVTLRWDDDWLYVGSNGVPDHPMMVGITAWQQQVPLPQPYTGNNAWQIPLHPVVAKDPLSAKSHFFRGAIAVAIDGIPIFNPIKNDGRTDTFLAGELDDFGGHCGRADDYHYHVAPLHLQKLAGAGKPIAYALDGYPIYGLTESDGSPVGKLDAFNGHADAQGNYHYHASKTYPYLNGGFHGEVTERGGQVDPQPRAFPVRPDGRPLRGAKIVAFASPKPDAYTLTYELRGQKYTINYQIEEGNTYRFEFVSPDGTKRTEVYHRRAR